jgi:hypothetical protein
MHVRKQGEQLQRVQAHHVQYASAVVNYNDGIVPSIRRQHWQVTSL